MVLTYNYHLRFELYSYSSILDTRWITDKITDSSVGVWIPPPDSNIFSTRGWPIHSRIVTFNTGDKEKSEQLKKSAQTDCNPDFSDGSGSSVSGKEGFPKSKKGIDLSLNSRSKSELIDCGPRKAVNSSVKGNNKIIRTRSVAQLESLQRAEKDWRFGSIVIASFDIEMGIFDEENNVAKGANHKTDFRETAGQSKSMHIGRNLRSDLTHEGSHRTGNGTKARFEPIIGKSTQVGWGVVHLYRDDDDDDDLVNTEPGSALEGGDECTTLCIPAVPNYLTPNYFLAWVGEKTREQVSHFRMVMTGQLMRYLVLMKFRDEKTAKIWKEEWDGRAFNSMEPETCHVVFIKSISFSTPLSTTTSSSTSFPALTHDPFTPPTASLIELPTCPVCLERLDETTGLLTILCQHVFHCDCLLKWKDSSCPVCRHTNPPSIDQPQEKPFGSGEASLCYTCECADDLWICLICGNVGCGRYKGGHAKEHWKDSAHCFALEIETQHVWDYAGDVWVHRLIRDKGDNSKVIELPSQSQHGPGSNRVALHNSPGDEDLVSRSKLEVLSVEYTHLLTSQLESQRMYFEDLIKKSTAEAAARSESRAQEEIKVLEQTQATLKSDLAAQGRELEREKNRAAKSAEMARTFSKNLIEERHVSEGLMKRIEHLNQGMARMVQEQTTLKAENCELRDTNRDLLFCLSAGEKVKEMEADKSCGLAPGELETGVVSLPDPLLKEKGKRKGKSREK